MMYAGTATHTTLLARLTDGQDVAAWQEFVDRYGELIRGFCLRRGLQAADCDDVRQEVLLSLSKSMPGFQYDPTKGLFRSYLKTVVSNAIFRKLRQNPGAHRLSEVDASGVDASRDGADGAISPAMAGANRDADEEQWEAEWRRYHLRRAMVAIEREFQEKDRLAFQMYGVEGRDAKETAKDLGMSVDAVYQAKSRVVRRLGQLIEQQVVEEG